MASLRIHSSYLMAFAFLALDAGSTLAACTVPNAFLNGQTTDADTVMQNYEAIRDCADKAAPAGVDHSLQIKTTTGTLSGISLGDGQLVIGATGGAPLAATVTPGPGVVVVNGAGSIVISASASPSANGVDWLNEAAIIRPGISSFSLVTSTIAPAGAAIVATERGMALTTTGGADGTGIMAETATPSGPWQATMLAVYAGSLSASNLPAISVRDTSSGRAVQFGIGAGPSGLEFSYRRNAGGSGLNETLGSPQTLTDIGLPAPAQPIWSRLTFDGVDLVWSFSRDGETFTRAFSVPALDNLSLPDRVGPSVSFQSPDQPGWPAAYHVLSWRLTSL